MLIETAGQLRLLEIGEQVTIEGEIWTRLADDLWGCAPWGDEDPYRDIRLATTEDMGEVVQSDDGWSFEIRRNRRVFDMLPSDYI